MPAPVAANCRTSSSGRSSGRSTPKGIIDFARAHPAIATNDELVRLVREARLEAWFGVVFRSYQGNGDVIDLPVAVRPGENTEFFQNTRAVLCLLAGKFNGSPAADRTNVEIEVIEEALMNLEPVEGLRRVLWRGPGRRLADDAMPGLVRTGGSADETASSSAPARDSLSGPHRPPRRVVIPRQCPYEGPSQVAPVGTAGIARKR
jgi:hypothetical protein